MSNAPPTIRTDAVELPTDSPTHRPVLPRAAIRALGDSVRFVGFWAAILLPALYLPLLFAGSSGVGSAAVLGLIVAHAAALVVGHDHGSA